jgi:hypothetical protein
MFKKMIVMTICLISSSLCADESPLSKTFTNGRYQLIVDVNSVYLFDTETGTVWRSPYSIYYDKHLPWVQLPPLPPHESNN